MYSPPSQRRLYNIDALRVISMFFVCYLHVSGGYGGIAQAVTIVDKALILYGHAFAVVGVNCFMMISGYIASGREWKCRSYINLWFQVVYYCVAVSLVLAGITWCRTGEWPISIQQFFAWNLPVPFASAYWYFTVYSAVFFFSPFLNKLMWSMHQRGQLLVLIAGIGMVSLLAPWGSPEGGKWGFTTMWMVWMYMMGGYLKRYPLKVKRRWKLLGAVSCVGGAALFFSISVLLTKHGIHVPYQPVGSTCPFVVLASVFVFSLFADMQVGCKSLCRFIELLVPVSFGVYLVHCHPMLEGYARELYGYMVGVMGHSFICVVVSSCVIYLVASCMDFPRLLLFRFFGIKDLAVKLEHGFGRLAYGMTDWLIRRIG